MSRSFLALALWGALLTSCASFDRRDLAGLQARGVPPPLVAKLRRDRPITPDEVITLSRRGVGPRTLADYVHRNGTDYALTHGDAVRLRQAGVDVRVIDALAEESASFEGDYSGRNGLSAVSVGVGPYPYNTALNYGFGYGPYNGFGNPFGYTNGLYW